MEFVIYYFVMRYVALRQRIKEKKMLFSSEIFLFLFLPVVLGLYYGINLLFKNNVTLKNSVLLGASVIFYAWGEPVFIIVMLLSIALNFIFGICVSGGNDKKRRAFMTLAVVFNLGILFVYKYLDFSIKAVNDIFSLKLPLSGIALPIGISFFTFQALSYVIDVYRKNAEVQKNIFDLALYIFFFPQLIAGPIVRYNTVCEQIKSRKESFSQFSEGVEKFIIGLGKKVLMANTLALISDKAFSLSPSDLSTAFAWLGAIAYTFMIYFDFSGYSDMAIGLGKMFGFEFEKNFDYPYISKSISEFWRRWHISMGQWFRDYLYFPLGGSRVRSKSRLIFNLFAVWLCTGIWHGANYTFIVWGLYFFLLLLFEKLTGKNPKGWFSHIYTMVFVIFGWVIFRADNLGYAFSYIKKMLVLSSCETENALFLSNVREHFFALISAPLLSVPIWKRIENKKAFTLVLEILIFALSVTYIIKGGYNVFIYFNF